MGQATLSPRLDIASRLLAAFWGESHLPAGFDWGDRHRIALEEADKLLTMAHGQRQDLEESCLLLEEIARRQEGRSGAKP